MNKIVILGAGITGRLAKLVFPEATVLESKKSDDIFTAELGVQISIIPIPELKNTEYLRRIYIDHQEPTLDSINRYHKKIARENGELSYGDFRQFEHEQRVFKQEFPNISDIYFEHSVLSVRLLEKYLIVRYLGVERKQSYDYLISTIPLLNLIQISDLCNLFKENTSAFFMHRPIYLLRLPDPEPKALTIIENYISDSETPIYRENYVDGWRNQESLFKIPNSIKIYPGKIYPCSASQHILSDLESYQVHCVGRYAQWSNTVHLWNVYSSLRKLRGII